MKKLVMAIIFITALCLSTMAGAGAVPVEFNPTGNIAKAYTSTEFNEIMTVYYGNELLRPLQAPEAYVKMVNSTPVFNNTAKAWKAQEYHQIFTAYGLVLNTENMNYKLGITPYARLVDGQVRFDKGNFAYTEWELTKIISLYERAPTEASFVDDDNDGVANQFDLCPGTPIGAKVNTDGCWVLDNKTLFAFDSSAINAAYLPMLGDVAKVIKNNPDMVVELDGHTDSTGPAAYNQKLSERRANAVRKVLIQNFGILPSRITAVGFGESNPIASNATKEGRAKNRRVELVPLW